MGKTWRDVPEKKWMRQPRNRFKKVDKSQGFCSREAARPDDWDDMPIAGRKEDWELKNQSRIN